jgi:hypothetical protein
LEPYDIRVEELPDEMQQALRAREAFTLLEGIDPIDIYLGRIDAESLAEKVLRHDQATLAVQQLRLYAAHNGRLIRGGRPLELEPIKPYPGFENPISYEIPEELPDDIGKIQSTTLEGKRPKGESRHLRSYRMEYHLVICDLTGRGMVREVARWLENDCRRR